MANIWDEFDKAIDTEGLAKDTEEAAENNGRREVPHGTYEVSIQKLELVKSKSKGDPMVTCWMKILEGEYKGSLCFFINVVKQGFHENKPRDLYESCCYARVQGTYCQ